MVKIECGECTVVKSDGGECTVVKSDGGEYTEQIAQTCLLSESC